MLLKFDGSWDLMEEGIRVAYLQYADIINVSSASECDWACKTLGCVNDEFSDLFNINYPLTNLCQQPETRMKPESQVGKVACKTFCLSFRNSKE